MRNFITKEHYEKESKKKFFVYDLMLVGFQYIALASKRVNFVSPTAITTTTKIGKRSSELYLFYFNESVSIQFKKLPERWLKAAIQGNFALRQSIEL